MMIKGKVKSVGTIENVSNGKKLLNAAIQIGVVKMYDRFSGQEIDAADMVSYNFWDDDAVAMIDTLTVGDIVEFDMSHYINNKYGRTETVCKGLKVVSHEKTTKENLIEKQAEKTAAKAADNKEDLTF